MYSTILKLVGGISILFACLISLLLSNLTIAVTAPSSPWLIATNPTLENISEVDLSQPLPESIIGNRDCQEREIITRPQRFVAPLQAKVSHRFCTVDTGYGAYSKDGYLQRSGSSIFGQLKTSRGDPALMMPIPRSSTGLQLSGGGSYGNFLFFYDNIEPALTSTAIYNGEVTHKLPADFSILKNGNGEYLSVDSSSMGFSANGDWVVADIPFIAVVRINTKTREVLPFADGSSPRSGLGMAFKTAISPDGKYAVVASSRTGTLKLYDLSTCATPPSVITAPVTCKSRELVPFMKEKVPGFTSLASVRFRSNYTLELYANSIVGPTTKLTRYVATAAGQQTTGFQYLALGDSFASGEGAYNYKVSTDVKDNKCHLSQRSYPYLISSVMGYGQYESVACSGAVIDDINNVEKVFNKPQAKGKTEKVFTDEVLTNFLPGYRTQVSFTERYKPGIVTISTGGNDIGFGDIILRCIDTDTCYDSYEDRLELAQLINQQFPRLTGMYNDIKASADPRAKIYVISYPQIAKVDGVCDMNVHLNRDERVFAEQLVSHLNGVIKKATENAGVFYVDVEDAFNGYKMCEPINSWDVAVNGLTAGNDKVDFLSIHGPIGNESFHPNALGHDLFKTKILQKTNNFTAVMPASNPNAKPNDLNSSTALLQSPKSNRVVRNLKHYTGTDGGVMRAGVYWGYEMSGLDDAFAAGSEVAAWLKSEPVSLGTYRLSTNGSITIGASIPTSVTPGFHTLHLYGKNSSGENIDVFKTVYVETGSPCLVPLSGQDKDKDGTDDACDGSIAKPPIVVPARTTQTQPQATTAGTQTAQASETAPTTEQQPTTQTTAPATNNKVLAAQNEETPTTKPLENLATASPTQQGKATSKTLLKYWPILLLTTLLILFLVFLIFA